MKSRLAKIKPNTKENHKQLYFEVNLIVSLLKNQPIKNLNLEAFEVEERKIEAILLENLQKSDNQFENLNFEALKLTKEQSLRRMMRGINT